MCEQCTFSNWVETEVVFIVTGAEHPTLGGTLGAKRVYGYEGEQEIEYVLGEGMFYDMTPILYCPYCGDKLEGKVSLEQYQKLLDIKRKTDRDTEAARVKSQIEVLKAKLEELNQEKKNEKV